MKSIDKSGTCPCMSTYSGLEFNFIDPQVDQINIFDIARGLSNRGHFGGQTDQFFSIAQHSLLVVDLMPSRFRNSHVMGMVALLHDASEAYTGDMIKPLKNLLPEFKKIEDKIMEVIFQKFDLPIKSLELVKKYDLLAQEAEYNTFFNRSNSLNYLKPEEAVYTFMSRFYHYEDLKRKKMEEIKNQQIELRTS